MLYLDQQLFILFIVAFHQHIYLIENVSLPAFELHLNHKIIENNTKYDVQEVKTYKSINEKVVLLIPNRLACRNTEIALIFRNKVVPKDAFTLFRIISAGAF